MLRLLPVLLLLCSCGSSHTLQPLATDAVILAFGDSLTYGTGTDRSLSYPTVLASMTGMTVVNEGVPGEVSSKGMARLPTVLDTHKPDLLVLIHGGNDMLRRTGMQQAKHNLRAMITLARSRGIDVVMLGVPKPGLILSAADFYEEIAEETGTPIDNDAIADILQYPANKSDAVHPNADGYRMLAEAVYDLLSDNGAIR